MVAGPAGSVDVAAPVSPRPYFLVQARDGDVWTAERLLPLKGGRNFRDMGGYIGAGGKQVRWGKLYRSGVMSGLTPADLSYLSDLGITSICDLRSVAERKADPAPFPAGGKTEVIAVDYEMISGMENIARAQSKAAAITAFADSYISFLDMLTPQYTALFARLVRGEGATTLNCSAGKDRTGVGSALILSTLGVARETVIADYALTQVYSPPAVYTQAVSSGAPTPGLTPDMAQAMRRMPQDALLVLMGSDPEVMRQALARVDQTYGGPVELVKAKFGVTDADVARIRQLYLV
jgi:protein-tyrosine phosphatase